MTVDTPSTLTTGTRERWGSARPENDRRAVESVAERLLASARTFVQDSRLPGAAVGVATRDGLVWSAGCGFADLASGRRPDVDTLFRIASITKLFTAVGILQLRDRGLLRLDDPLVAHLPEAAAIADPFGPIEEVTIRRLLTHESGLQGEHPYDDPAVYSWPPVKEALAALDRARVAIPPSSQNKYSNLGYDLLGEVVARSGNGDWEDTARERILAPLGMASTTCRPTGDLLARCAVGYNAREYDDRVPPAPETSPDLIPGAGMLWSTVADLARFVAFALTADRDAVDRRADGERAPVLSPRTLAEMQDCRILSSRRPPGHQGLGWYAETGPDGTSWIGHGGAWWGFLSRIVFSPADGVGAIVLLNGVEDPDKPATQLATIAAEALRARREERASPPPPPPAQATRILGEYEDADFADRVRVEWRDSRMMLLDEKGESYGLEPTDDRLVWLVRGGRFAGEPARFLLDERGEVVAANFAGNPMWRLRLGSAARERLG
jgi:CubicO group peptidase (beta-lactamase class C family)